MNRLPELSYALSEARSTPLLAEFNAILNLGETFGPLLPLDAAITFYAPLRSSLADFRGAPASFDRASEGLYFRSGLWRIALDRSARFEDTGLLMEPAITNKCENWNANPDELLAGLTLTGDPAATVSRVDDSAELDLFGLSAICSSGFVVLLDNSAGVSNADLVIDGECGNLNDHTLSVVARGSGNIVIRLVGPTSTQQTLEAHYQSYSVLETPAGTTREMMIRALPGTVCYFVLNQLEELPVPSSPIITQGAAASRAQDRLTYANADRFFNQAQGMALITMRPGFDKAQYTSIEGLLTVNTGFRSNVAFYDTAFRSNDGTNQSSIATPNFVADDRLKVAALYGPAGPGALLVGYQWNHEAWAWPGTAQPYAGAYPTNDVLSVVENCGVPVLVSNIQLYNENRGAAWVEANY